MPVRRAAPAPVPRAARGRTGGRPARAGALHQRYRLTEHGVSADRVRHGIAAIVGRARVLVGDTFRPQPNLQAGCATTRLGAIFERALDHAASHGRSQLATAMLLLALPDDPNSLNPSCLPSLTKRMPPARQ
jgi:hypothetical protein